MDELKNLRQQIDSIDETLMSLLNERFDISLSVGAYKKENKVRVLDSSRENFILDKISKYSHSPQIREIYKVIMAQSKSLQRK